MPRRVQQQFTVTYIRILPRSLHLRSRSSLDVALADINSKQHLISFMLDSSTVSHATDRRAVSCITSHVLWSPARSLVTACVVQLCLFCVVNGCFHCDRHHQVRELLACLLMWRQAFVLAPSAASFYGPGSYMAKNAIDWPYNVIVALAAAAPGRCTFVRMAPVHGQVGDGRPRWGNDVVFITAHVLRTVEFTTVVLCRWCCCCCCWCCIILARRRCHLSANVSWLWRHALQSAQDTTQWRGDNERVKNINKDRRLICERQSSKQMTRKISSFPH